MKASHFFFTFLLLLPSFARAQFWAESVGGNDVDEVMDMCSDNTGNIITAGYFTNTSNFGQFISLTSTSIGIPDIFVQKCSQSGNPIWAVRAGGSGSDRALSVKTDAAGNIYITGFYFGAATFGNITLNSVNGSKDAFIAKLDNSGNFVWAVSAGGNLADIGNAIDLDAAGNIFITGQFEGNATFGSSSFISMNNPQTNIPSIDVFISKLDNNGNFLWTKQGAAPYTDRGLDIAVDNAGNAFVCGQFSDTIQFSNTYLNPVMNAVFLMKVDGNGNEIFFRRASGTFSIAYAVAIDNAQNVYVTGDYQGTLAFYGPPNNFLTDNYSQRIFLAKYSNAGNFIWASSSSSDNPLSSRGVAIDPNNDPYIVGEFGCTLNDYADLYGQGTFNSVGYKDIFTTKFNSAGQFQWARNFGGPSAEQAHGIFVKTVDMPTIAGSYEKHCCWPITNFTVTSYSITTQYLSQTSNSSYCSDPSYGLYAGIQAAGFSDGFVAMAVDINRQPYDYYHRVGFGCSRVFIPGCIDPFTFSCPDTLRFCGTGNLIANTWTGSGLQNTIGPDYHFQWSTMGNDTNYNLNINATNYYDVRMTTRDGCYTSDDTVYAIVNPLPQPPTITDDHGININHPQWGLPIVVCAPDTVLLSTGNYSPGDTVEWFTTSGMGGNLIAANDSVSIFTSGYYNTVVTNQFGCKNYNNVQIELDSALLNIFPKSLIPDSATICLGDYVRFFIYDTINNPSANPNYMLNWINNHWSSSPALTISSGNLQMTGICNPNTTGMYHITDTFYYYNACNRDTFIIRDSIYITVNPLPHISLSITGPNFLCHGDTALLLVSANPSTTQNTSWTLLPNDTIFATVAGTYGAISVITDTITGCSSPGNASFILQPKPNPILTTAPASGLICPNDSVYLMENTVGINYTWIGPTGILPPVTQNIYDSIPGFYHCIVTDADGCVLTSNTVELKQYNTPYLLADPGNVVCLNQNSSITLTVITNDTTLINWLPPLSGATTQQVVTQSGTYSCNVTMCGITTLCSINVVVSQAIAQITGATSVCPGDSTWLLGNSGMAVYLWSPGNAMLDSVFVSAGTYTLTTTDINGCTASANYSIVTDTSVARPLANGIIICSGATATVSATAIGPVLWYLSSSGGNPIGSGNTFVSGPLFSDTIFFAETYDSTGCHSLRTPVTVTIDPASLSPVITANDTLCYNTTLFLSTANAGNVNYHWSGPAGFTSTLQNPVVNNVTAINSGNYFLYISDANCSSATDSIFITVVNPVIAGITGNQTVCEGTTVSFLISNPDSNATYLWSGPNNFTSTADSLHLFPADTSQSGIYLVTETLGACQSMTDTFNLTVLPAPPFANAYSNSPLCLGDTLFLFADTLAGNISYLWNGLSSGFTSTQQNPVITNQAYSEYFSLNIISTNGCTSTVPAFVLVTLNYPPQIYLGPDTTICSGGQIILQPAGNFSSYLWQDNSTGNFIIADSSQIYYVTVVDSNGCIGSDSVNVTTINCQLHAPNVFTPNGDGVNDYFSFIGQNFKSVECKIYNRYGTLVYAWDDPNGKWDGSNIQTKQIVNEGVYYFTAHAITYDGAPVEVAGFIQLMR